MTDPEITHEDDGRLTIGTIAIAVVMLPGRKDYAPVFDVDGIDRTAAIGYLQVVQDRLRKEVEFDWDTCPDCGRPWSEHIPEDSEEDDDELLD